MTALRLATFNPEYLNPPKASDHAPQQMNIALARVEEHAMKSQPIEINKPCNRCAARMLKIVGVILLPGLAGIVLMELAHAASDPLHASVII